MELYQKSMKKCSPAHRANVKKLEQKGDAS